MAFSISVLPAISKIYERIISSQIIDYIDYIFCLPIFVRIIKAIEPNILT